MSTIAERAVADENVSAATSASTMSATDARWILASLTSDRIGRGGLLTPMDRDRLVRDARRLGVRPFDASLVFAIVQDAARRGGPALSAETADRLKMVGPAQRREHATLTRTAMLVFVLATMLFWLMVYWLTGAV